MQLNEGLKNGSMSSFEKVYKLHFKKVYGISLKYLRDECIASDITQDVFLKLWRNRAKISMEHTLDQQLFVIAKGIIIDHFRKVASEEKLLCDFKESDVSETKDEQYANAEKLRKIYKTIEDLPQKRKEIFKMLKFQGLTYDEISEKLGISPNTVSNHITAAIKEIRERLRGSIRSFFLGF
jgi:RNA polymerase sigma-70 factor (ECF subfamily)